MRRRESISSFPSSSDDASSRQSTSSRRHGQAGAASFDAPPYDFNASQDDVLGTETETEDEGYERAREKRKKRQGKRREGEEDAAAGARRREKPVYEMRSLGVQPVQLKNILPGGQPSQPPSASSKPAANPPPTDLEKQASKIRKDRRMCATMSTARKAYIIGVIVLCVVLVVLSIFIGVNGGKEREERDKLLEEKNPDSGLYEAQEHLEEEASSAQSQLKKYKTDVSGGGASATATAALPGQTGIFAQFPELHDLLAGNREWRNETEEEDPGLIEELAEGQEPKFAYIGCADSRVPETTILDAKPGELFVTRNVGNQYLIDDLSSETVMSYAIAHLGVQHIVVMGHTECGAVQAAIASPSEDVNSDIGETRIDSWIRPIRQLYSKSNRSEIVDFREKTEKQDSITADDITDDVWRALVEENVKLNVERVAHDTSVTDSWSAWKSQSNSTTTASAAESSSTGAEHRKRASHEKEAVELWVHGWVYDVSTGLVSDLGVSVGPNGAYEG
ncbi:hypothetical protein JCM6882_003742 [Rhodosporidiobolus microsporus]